MYWINPLTYSLRALTLNEFTAARWDIPDPQNPSQVRILTFGERRNFMRDSGLRLELEVRYRLRCEVEAGQG